MTIFVIEQMQDEYWQWEDVKAVGYSMFLHRAVMLAQGMSSDTTRIVEYPLGETNPTPLNIYSVSGEPLP